MHYIVYDTYNYHLGNGSQVAFLTLSPSQKGVLEQGAFGTHRVVQLGNWHACFLDFVDLAHRHCTSALAGAPVPNC
jgi:hypothetical protein